MATKNVFDVLVIGSGAAGLGLALSLDSCTKVAIITKGSFESGSSSHAQGGIASVMSQDDSYESHIEDTLKAGAGLCDKAVVEFTVKNAKSAIEWLISQGVQFTMEPNSSEFHLAQEGGHGRRRIMHVADKTGYAVIKTLNQQIQDRQNIQCFSDHTALELLTHENKCMGVIALHNKTQQSETFFAKHVVLATGGASYAYLHTSNWDMMSGDGIAMAWRAGCRVAKLEFNQFHPTCLFHPDGNLFLISEAVRGEGATLVLPNGERFMPNYHEQAELAPRDIVTRAIYDQLKKHDLPCVYLDISHQPADMIKSHFPTIYAKCLEFNIDMTKDLIPVVPAAHYTCGGVMTNCVGETDIENLYAVGEVAHTGLHGANRIASNSLLECLVFAMSASQAIQKKLSEESVSADNFEKIIATFPHPIQNKSTMSSETSNEITYILRKLMWDKVGIVRTTEQLTSALSEIQAIKSRVEREGKLPQGDPLHNLITVCELITRCALSRKESRGGHFNLDYAGLSKEAKNSILIPKNNEV
jgi:L-aspartate oxidase